MKLSPDLRNPQRVVTMGQAKEGDRLEFSPRSVATVLDMAKRLSEDSGAALIVDYGHNGASPNSLRGIQNHEFVSPFKSPGKTDLVLWATFKGWKAGAL